MRVRDLFIVILMFPFWLFSQYQDFEKNYELSICKGPVPVGLTNSFSERLNKNKSEDETKDRKGRKQNYEFYESSHYYLDQLLRSGRVLFGDELTNYVNTVAVNLLEKAGKNELIKELDFYVLKSQEVNAFTIQDGSIFVTVGLLAQIENEAELTFVLSHEIAHYELKHNIKIFKKSVEAEKKRRKGISQVNDLLKMLSNYSKESELEADKVGLETFLAAGYSAEEAKKTMLVLQYSFLPFDEKKFNVKYFNTEYYKIPESYFIPEESTTKISDNSEEEDKFLSHPNISKRISQLDDIIGNKKSDGKAFQLDSKLFDYINTKARFEQLYLGLLSKNFLRVIYESFLLKQDYPNNEYLDKQIALGLYGMFKMRLTSNRLGEDIFETYDTEGEILSLKAMLMSAMNISELGLLAIDKLDDTELEELKPYRDQIINDLSIRLDFDYEKLLNKNSIIETEYFEELDSIQYVKLTKIEKINYNIKKKEYEKNSNLRENGQLDSTGYFLSIFSDKEESDEIFNVFNEATKETSNSRKTVFNRKRNSKKNLDSIVVLEPIYVDFKTGYFNEDVVFYESSIIKKEELRKSLQKVTELYDKNIVNLESSNLDSIKMEDLNADYILKEWYNELFENEELGLLSFSQPRADKVFESLQCKNIMIVVILDDRKRSKRTFKYAIILNNKGEVEFSDSIATKKEGHPIYNELFINDVISKISKR